MCVPARDLGRLESCQAWNALLAETAAMLFWALPASRQITMRRVDGWPILDRSPTDLDLAA